MIGERIKRGGNGIARNGQRGMVEEVVCICKECRNRKSAEIARNEGELARGAGEIVRSTWEIETSAREIA